MKKPFNIYSDDDAMKGKSGVKYWCLILSKSEEPFNIYNVDDAMEGSSVVKYQCVHWGRWPFGRALVSHAGDRGFKPWSSQLNDL